LNIPPYSSKEILKNKLIFFNNVKEVSTSLDFLILNKTRYLLEEIIIFKKLFAFYSITNPNIISSIIATNVKNQT
jgi:hypothetical protein